MEEDKIIIYTDGACKNNPGPGGWAAILKWNDATKEISGFEADTTNNRMELMAIIQALESVKRTCPIEVYSDSAYIINALTQKWYTKWQINGWKTADRKQVKNIDLWEKLIELNNKYNVTWNKVKGHADDVLNNRCDFLARNQIETNI